MENCEQEDLILGKKTWSAKDTGGEQDKDPQGSLWEPRDHSWVCSLAQAALGVTVWSSKPLLPLTSFHREGTLRNSIHGRLQCGEGQTNAGLVGGRGGH